MSGMSQLGIITLTSIFTVTLLALLSQILYLLWRRRQYTRRNITRIEPSMASIAPPPLSTTLSICPDPSEFPKFEAIYGPSRVLFTIKEEEREELEMTHLSSFRERMNLEMVGLSERFENGCSFHEDYVISMVGGYSDVEPPFFTPCSSPPYYTPSPSPPRKR